MSYVFQTFSVSQVLTAAQMNQAEVNIRDHKHGTSSVESTPAMKDAANAFTADNGLKRVYGAATFGMRLGGYTVNDGGVNINRTEADGQDDASKVSWGILFNVVTDVANLQRAPAGGARANLVTWDNTGKMSAGSVPLARIGTVIIDSSSVVTGNTATSVTIEASTGAHVFYIYTIRGNNSQVIQGTSVTTAEAVTAAFHSFIGMPGGTGNNTLELVNGTSGSITATYKIYKITET